MSIPAATATLQEVDKKQSEFRIRINESGRLVLPKELREALAIEAGDLLFFTRDGDGVRMETQKQRIRRAQDYICSLIGPERSLADELIAERREDFRKEMAE